MSQMTYPGNALPLVPLNKAIRRPDALESVCTVIWNHITYPRERGIWRTRS
jgi:hypothetical protein